MTTGFARNTVMGVADTVISAVKSELSSISSSWEDVTVPSRDVIITLISSKRLRRIRSSLPWLVVNTALMISISEKSEASLVCWTWGSVMTPILQFRLQSL